MMRFLGRILIIVSLVWISFMPAMAVEPGEMLANPALEERAREISKNLRCLVCRNESIDDSDAGLAKDLRLLVRERLLIGDSDAQVTEFVVSRYGEFVLLKPKFSAANAILWLAGPLMLLVGLAIAYSAHRSRKTPITAELDEDEKARVEALLKR